MKTFPWYLTCLSLVCLSIIPSAQADNNAPVASSVVTELAVSAPQQNMSETNRVKPLNERKAYRPRTPVFHDEHPENNKPDPQYLRHRLPERYKQGATTVPSTQ